MADAATSSDRFPRLAKYELLAEIGHGGMATVYRARDLRLDREVAVKVIHKHLRDNQEVRRRFVAEAKAVAKLRHPGIVDVYDVSDDEDEERYLVVELIAGTTLRMVLEDHGPLPAEIGAIITAMLCEAVQHAHQNGVIHRDIKPENVLISPPEGAPASPKDSSTSSHRHARVKLTDFGIAKVLDAQGVTSTGQILGSPAHMAPEQIEGGAIGPHTDVFALGVLMYECMVGHLPFAGSNPAQVLRRVLEGRFEPADSERPEVGARWGAILARALQVEPEKRLQSAAELARLIGSELADLGAGDAGACLDAYFAEPAAFGERWVAELVPRLIDRGERERKHGHVQGAAADFNRALAFRPDDLAILKRASSLSAEQAWKRRVARAGAIAVGALALGAGSYRLARALRPRRANAAATSTPTATPTPTSTSTSIPTSTSTSTPTVTPPASADAAAETSASVHSSELSRGKLRRNVKFTAYPPGATLLVNGAQIDWFGKPQQMAPGSYAVKGFVKDSVCCEETSTTITVTEPPRDNPDQVQRVPIRLPIRDATVVLKNAPPTGSVTCSNGILLSGNGSAVAKMGEVDKPISCTVNGKSQSLTLFAGKTTIIVWQ